MNSLLLVSFGVLLASLIFSQSDTLAFVSKDLHVKHKGYTYKMVKVSEEVK